jgi:hypothetical protein
MIPAQDVPLDAQSLARWQLTKLAAALVRDGVSVDLVMSDCREGCELARKAGS